MDLCLTSIGRLLEMNTYCDNIVHFNEDMTTVSPVTTSVAVFLIFASNGLIIVIANVDKTLKSSVFVIIQSLSVTSIIRGIIFILMRHFECYMLQFAHDLSLSHSTACHLQRIDVYVDNAILYQLCLLVFQRLALAISPLKVHLLITRKHVVMAIGVAVTISWIVDTLFAVSVTTTCQEKQECVDLDSPQVLYEICLALLLVLLLACSIIISLFRTKLFGIPLESTPQQIQSKVAAIAIISFMSIYVLFIGLNIYIYYACLDNTNAYFDSDWLINHLPLLLYKFIPIILFLRLKSIRNFLLPPCKCINYDR